jgi:hypothetical protein
MSGVRSPRGRCLKFREAVRYLGFVKADGSLDEQHLRRLVARRKIPFLNDGRLGFYEHDLDEWIAAHRESEAHASRVAAPKPGRVIVDRSDGIEDLLHDIRRRGPSPFYEQVIEK